MCNPYYDFNQEGRLPDTSQIFDPTVLKIVLGSLILGALLAVGIVGLLVWKFLP